MIGTYLLLSLQILAVKNKITKKIDKDKYPCILLNLYIN